MSSGPEPPSMQTTAHAWTIVSQVKSHRIVYFTDDPDYQPPAQGDWYYCSPYEGSLPPGMTLRNCWGWRFNGSTFVDAREPKKADAKESLLESNRQALLKLLREKIDEVRKPWLATCRGGDVVRSQKLQAARDFLDGREASADAMAILEAVAVSRQITLTEAAQLVHDRKQQMDRVLLESERFREQLTQAIAAAKSQPQLLEIREWIQERVYPELSQRFVFPVDNTRPIDLDQPLGETQQVHERARLRARLRELINAKRQTLDSAYVRNEEVWRHKGRIAQAVLAHDGELPPGMDGSVLEAYATARGVSLAVCAETVVQALAQAAQVLTETEAMKDAYLARIDGARNLREIREIEGLLSEEAIHPTWPAKTEGKA